VGIWTVTLFNDTSGCRRQNQLDGVSTDLGLSSRIVRSSEQIGKRYHLFQKRMHASGQARLDVKKTGYGSHDLTFCGPRAVTRKAAFEMEVLVLRFSCSVMSMSLGLEVRPKPGRYRKDVLVGPLRQDVRMPDERNHRTVHFSLLPMASA